VSTKGNGSHEPTPADPLKRLVTLEKQALEDSERWFGDQMSMHTMRGLVHHALAMSGEVGEVANIIKKIDRGSLDLNDATVRHELHMELVDVFVYLLNLAGLLGLDLEKGNTRKRSVNDARFGEARRKREQIKEDRDAVRK
jgi:NTP pyrophosphatase (non-canonical NTP hydrolase)